MRKEKVNTSLPGIIKPFGSLISLFFRMKRVINLLEIFGVWQKSTIESFEEIRLKIQEFNSYSTS